MNKTVTVISLKTNQVVAIFPSGKVVNLAGDFAKVVIPDGKYFVFDQRKYAFSQESNKRVKVVNWV